uniref:Dirigent protein n=1 Tax=Chenopodium quinoa TaxID=63459 RepID=A0A803MGZ7_CHEQI
MFFPTFDDAVTWADAVAVNLGFILVKSSYNKTRDVWSYRYLRCDRGHKSKPRDFENVIRKDTKTKANGCPFYIKIYYEFITDSWKIHAKNDATGTHNQPMIVYQEGYRKMCGLSPDAKKVVRDMTKSKVAPRNIMAEELFNNFFIWRDRVSICTRSWPMTSAFYNIHLWCTQSRIPYLPATTTRGAPPPTPWRRLKILRFTLYLHETFNKTSYFIVKDVAGPSGITTKSNPFGSLFAFNDPFDETPDPSSKVVGYSEGSSVTSSFDGERTVAFSRISLNLKGYKGELLNVGTPHSTKVSELPFVGGTGDFRFVQGYMTTTSVVDLSGPTTCYKIGFNLFWPPYAALAHDIVD